MRFKFVIIHQEKLRSATKTNQNVGNGNVLNSLHASEVLVDPSTITSAAFRARTTSESDWPIAWRRAHTPPVKGAPRI